MARRRRRESPHVLKAAVAGEILVPTVRTALDVPTLWRYDRRLVTVVDGATVFRPSPRENFFDVANVLRLAHVGSEVLIGVFGDKDWTCAIDRSGHLVVTRSWFLRRLLSDDDR